MKAAVIGSSVVAGLMILAVVGFADSREAYAQRRAGQEASAGSDLIAFTAMVGESQQLTIIDPKNRVISVYHVESDGKIALKSVRRIEWDLQMVHLNSAKPLPLEVRSLVQQ
ncbi:MAG TPA: hypothetical protein VMV10_16700 [Pirellulales bacterium]|nr:hypothetical protein [Pirellulales bacterium]